MGVMFGGVAVGVNRPTWDQWILSIAIASFSVPLALVTSFISMEWVDWLVARVKRGFIRIIPRRISQRYRTWKKHRRLKKRKDTPPVVSKAEQEVPLLRQH